MLCPSAIQNCQWIDPAIVQDAGVERLPSEVELEMVRLRQEVEKSRLKEIELEEARLAAEQRLQTSADVCLSFL